MSGPVVARRVVEGHAYIPGIDGLRALAVLAVMVFHLSPSWLPGGFTGVDVFFVISGYVVTASMVRDRELPFHRFLAAFYARRLRRIVPALAFCLIATVVVSIAVIPASWLSSSLESTALHAFWGLSNLALVASDDGYFAPRTEFNPFTHTWSLAVEEQFYLVFPALAYAWITRTNHLVGRVTRAVFPCLVVSSFAWSVWATWHATSHAYYLIPSRFWEMAVGAILCLAPAAWTSARVQQIGPRVIGIVGAGLVGASLVCAGKDAFPFPWALPPVVGSGMIVLALAHGGLPGRIGSLLQSRPMVAIGLLSYSLYLWHWPIYTLLRWTVGLESVGTIALAVVLTVTLAYASYQYVEAPFQSWRLIRRAPNWMTVGAGAAVLFGAWFSAATLYDHASRIQLSTVSRNARDWYPQPSATVNIPGKRCNVSTTRARLHGSFVSTTYSPTGCSVGEPLHVFVAGDSHAVAYARLLHMTVAATGIEVTIYSRAGCPLASFLRPDSPACSAHDARVLRDISSRSSPGDIVWLASLRSVRLTDQWHPIKADVSEASARVKVQRRAAEADARRLVSRLTASGLRVLIDAPLPVFPAPAYRCSDAFNRMNPDCAGGLVIARAASDSRRREILDAIGRVARSSQRVLVWDPLPSLCPGRDCMAVENGRPLFFDGDHLSGFGNERLFAPFVRFLAERLPSVDGLRDSGPTGSSG